jgi:hypothetical protein
LALHPKGDYLTLSAFLEAALYGIVRAHDNPSDSQKSSHTIDMVFFPNSSPPPYPVSANSLVSEIADLSIQNKRSV